MARRTHGKSPTLLAVGEGDVEEAFLQHLRGLYCSTGPESPGVRVTVRNAHGGSPDSIVTYAIGQCRDADYDRRLILLDTDIPWNKATRDKARVKRMALLGSAPCIEGLLLRILNLPVPTDSATCKIRLRQKTGSDMTDRSDFALFDKPTLDAARGSIPVLDEILRHYQR